MIQYWIELCPVIVRGRNGTTHAKSLKGKENQERQGLKIDAGS